MSKKKNKTGILGGTFNPVHCGHLIIAEAIRSELGLDRVLFMPSGVPPHKSSSELMKPFHRYRMVELAVSGMPFFEASSIEVDRKGVTYTIDTLDSLRAIYGKDKNYIYIIGADVLFELTTWKDFQRVFKSCSFAAAMRPGFDECCYIDQAVMLGKKYGADIIIVKAPLVEISSTQIRECIKSGDSIKGLVPESVEKYIYENMLFI